MLKLIEKQFPRAEGRISITTLQIECPLPTEVNLLHTVIYMHAYAATIVIITSGHVKLPYTVTVSTKVGHLDNSGLRPFLTFIMGVLSTFKM